MKFKMYLLTGVFSFVSESNADVVDEGWIRTRIEQFVTVVPSGGEQVKSTQ